MVCVVITTPIQPRVVARHAQPVDFNGRPVKFDGGLGRTFGLYLKIGDVNASKGASRTSIAVVDFEAWTRECIVGKVDALKPQVHGIDREDAVPRGAADAAVPASHIARRGLNIVGFFVIETRLLFRGRRRGAPVVFCGQIPEVHAPGVENMSARVPVVGQMHPFDEHRSTVNDEALLGVVVQHPIAALHSTARR